MKKNILLYLMFVHILMLNAQVGIGTQNPAADFHVAGDLLVQTEFDLSSLTTVTNTEQDFKLLTRVTNSTPPGNIRVLDTDHLTVPPITILNYEITNMELDNVTNLALDLDPNKYIVGISNFRYVGDALKKVPSGTTKSIGSFVMRTYVQFGRWHIEIRNRQLDLLPTDSVDYHITLTIYDRKYFRSLPRITQSLNGLNNGTATTVPVLN